MSTRTADDPLFGAKQQLARRVQDLRAPPPRIHSFRLTFLSREQVSLVDAVADLTTSCLGRFSFATVEPLALRGLFG